MFSIAELHTESWLNTYRGILADQYLDDDLLAERERLWTRRFSAPEPSQHVVLAEEQNSLAGFACAFGAHDPEHGTLLENLHVRKTSRGTGIGAALVRAVARWSLEAHPGMGIHLWALARNVGARAFYERLGGIVTAENMWAPPVGDAVPEVRYSWTNPDVLLQRNGLSNPTSSATYSAS